MLILCLLLTLMYLLKMSYLISLPGVLLINSIKFTENQRDCFFSVLIRLNIVYRHLCQILFGVHFTESLNMVRQTIC